MRKLIATLLVLVLILSFTGCGSTGGTDNRIKASKSSSDLKGKDYRDVQTLLQVAGFTNIGIETIDDLIVGWLTKDGEVEKVSINGDTDFSASSKFPTDAKVVITYHTFPAKKLEQTTKMAETLKTTAPTKASETSKAAESAKASATTKATANISAPPLDLNAINNTNSAKADAQFVGKIYRVTGIVAMAGGPSDGLNAMIIIEPNVMAKGMGLSLPLEINIWLTADEFDRIGGTSIEGKPIDMAVKLTSISRNSISKDPKVLGYPIQLEFGDSK